MIEVYGFSWQIPSLPARDRALCFGRQAACARQPPGPVLPASIPLPRLLQSRARGFAAWSPRAACLPPIRVTIAFATVDQGAVAM